MFTAESRRLIVPQNGHSGVILVFDLCSFMSFHPPIRSSQLFTTPSVLQALGMEARRARVAGQVSRICTALHVPLLSKATSGASRTRDEPDTGPARSDEHQTTGGPSVWLRVGWSGTVLCSTALHPTDDGFVRQSRPHFFATDSPSHRKKRQAMQQVAKIFGQS